MKFIKIETKYDEVHYISFDKCERIVCKDKKIQKVEYRGFVNALGSEEKYEHEVGKWAKKITLVNDDELLED